MIDQEILRVALHYSMPGASDVMNVFHFLYEGTGDTDSSILTDLDTWLTDVWGDDWSDMASSDVSMLYADLDIVDTAGLVVRNLGIATVPVTGANPNDETAVAASFFMLADTGFPRNRGKKYVPGIPQTEIENGLLTVTQLAKLVVLLATYMATIETPANGDLLAGVLSLTRAAFLEFTGSGLATDVPAYQRRRKPNVGA